MKLYLPKRQLKLTWNKWSEIVLKDTIFIVICFGIGIFIATIFN